MILKRLFDTCLAAVLIVVLLPVLALIALVILLESGRPVLYVSRRSGQHDRIIPVLKFRSMVHDADAQKARLRARNHRRDGPLFKVVDDPRVTRIGRILRRWSLDELPQLFNVVLGHLALVGPRPHLPSEVEHYSDRERRVFAVKPGVTGLAQVSGRSDLTFQEEIRLDLQYIEEWSLRLDLWVLWRTLVVVLSRKGAD
jgi:lipopolysaccharide/colanic/teichoic acid biosynthesis glycosyltransferase